MIVWAVVFIVFLFCVYLILSGLESMLKRRREDAENRVHLTLIVNNSFNNIERDGTHDRSSETASGRASETAGNDFFDYDRDRLF